MGNTCTGWLTEPLFSDWMNCLWRFMFDGQSGRWGHVSGSLQACWFVPLRSCCQSTPQSQLSAMAVTGWAGQRLPFDKRVGASVRPFYWIKKVMIAWYTINSPYCFTRVQKYWWINFLSTDSLADQAPPVLQQLAQSHHKSTNSTWSLCWVKWLI